MDHPALSNKPLAAALATHRFGLGQARSADIAGDAPEWLVAQLGAAPAQHGSNLVNSAQGVRQYAEFLRQQRQARLAANSPAAPAAPATMAPGGSEMAPGMAADGAPTAAQNAAVDQAIAAHFRQIVSGDVRARLSTAVLSPQPLTERLALFWANHFTVSVAKPSVRGLAGAFEREAIRPHIGGSFESLLTAAVTHAAMLRYLDNDQSAGPDSAIVRRVARRVANNADMQRAPRITGLNENLAREVLELHTLGVSGGGAAYGGWGHYSQADVTAFAAVLTGWRVAVADPAPATGATRFDPAWHQPGAKNMLGQRYSEGPDALAAVLHTLALHPNTARFVSYKLARHFIADNPAPALVAQMENTWRETEGHLPSVMRTLLQAPQSWQPQQAKLKTPEEFVISTARLLGLGESAFERQPDGGIGQLGQRIHAAPSPAGWSDRADDWLGPDAVWKRVEWATRVADRVGRRVDARALAQSSLGGLLHPDTARQIERASDGPQALALLLMAPEFQRR